MDLSLFVESLITTLKQFSFFLKLYTTPRGERYRLNTLVPLTKSITIVNKSSVCSFLLENEVTHFFELVLFYIAVNISCVLRIMSSKIKYKTNKSKVQQVLQKQYLTSFFQPTSIFFQYKQGSKHSVCKEEDEEKAQKDKKEVERQIKQHYITIQRKT